MIFILNGLVNSSANIKYSDNKLNAIFYCIILAQKLRCKNERGGVWAENICVSHLKSCISAVESGSASFSFGQIDVS